jgi:outer membrane protein assembly factor BamE (lipoprotein component of BamABCDE complex)
MRQILKIWSHSVALAALLAIAGCTTSGQTISASNIEERIAALRVGQSTKAEVEGLLGTDHTTDRNRWFYNFSDTAFDISERKQGPGLGIIPVSAGVVPTNTRAVVTVAFNDSGVIKRLEVSRLFEEPFVNDFWYAVNDAATEPLDSIAKLAESFGMKVVGLDKEAGSFTLEDKGTRAKVMVKLDGQTLRLTSRNPHSRLSSEYRAYAKRESALTSRIVESEIVQ